MKNLEPFWYTPLHQPNEESPVKFQLRPLNMPTFWAIQTSIPEKSNIPRWDGIAAVWEYSVMDWSGRPLPFSREAKREALEVMDRDMSIWLGQIAGKLYTTAVLSEEEKKTS